MPVWVLLPFVGLSWLPFDNHNEPRMFGFPFFYWYQLAWVPVTALLTWAARRAAGRQPAVVPRPQQSRLFLG